MHNLESLQFCLQFYYDSTVLCIFNQSVNQCISYYSVIATIVQGALEC